LVTLTDLLEEILGRLPERDHRDEPLAIKRAGGSWLIDARMDVEQVCSTLGIEELFPAEEDGDHHTLAGLIIQQNEGLPYEGISSNLLY
jgi:putative hemolysin